MIWKEDPYIWACLGRGFMRKEKSRQTLASNSCHRANSFPLKLIGLYGELEGETRNQFRCFSPLVEPWRSTESSIKVGSNRSAPGTVLRSPQPLETTAVRIHAPRRPVGAKLVEDSPPESRSALALVSTRNTAMAATVSNSPVPLVYFFSAYWFAPGRPS
jgi:hypothetical protein